MSAGSYPAAKYKEVSPGQFDIIDDPETGDGPWIPLDPLQPDLQQWPCYDKAKPLHITVNAGEMLYLPSLWFHHVRQDQATIAGKKSMDGSSVVDENKSTEL